MSSEVHQTDAEASAPVPRAALFIDATTPRDHAVRTILHRQGYEIEEVVDVRTAIHAAHDRHFDLAVVGFLFSAMPTLDDLIEVLRARLRCPLICVKRGQDSMLELERVTQEIADPTDKRRQRQVRQKAE